MNSKQVIVVRKDLKMRRGKEIAQSAHASLGVFSKKWKIVKGVIKPAKITDKATIDWFESSFAKICVYVNSEEELLNLHKAAEKAGIQNCLIKDSGRTEFNNVPTYTVLAIGPAWSDDIDKLTGNLTLY